MEIRLLTDRKLIKKIHKEHLLKDFPENESTPWIYIKAMLDDGKYECYGLYDGEELLGYAFFLKPKIEGKKYYLLDYLAIFENGRNRGAGSEFVRLLGRNITDADCIIAEIEDPEMAENEEGRSLRTRRMQFYQRNGYLITEAKANVRGADYCLIEFPSGPIHSDDEIREIYTEIYRNVAPPWFMEKMFEIK